LNPAQRRAICLMPILCSCSRHGRSARSFTKMHTACAPCANGAVVEERRSSRNRQSIDSDKLARRNDSRSYDFVSNTTVVIFEVIFVRRSSQTRTLSFLSPADRPRPASLARPWRPPQAQDKSADHRPSCCRPHRPLSGRRRSS